MLNFWTLIFTELLNLIMTYWYIPVGYAALYSIGALIFLFTVRGRQENGTTIIDHRSLAYRIAHPIGWHSLKNVSDIIVTRINICRFYSRMFHMLLLVWPILIFLNIIITLLFSIFTFLCAGRVITGTLANEDTPFKVIAKLKTEKGEIWPVFILIPIMFLLLAIFNRVVLFVVLKWLLTGLFYLLPLAAIIGLGILIIYRVRKNDPEAVNLLTEFISSKKEKLCKMVLIK